MQKVPEQRVSVNGLSSVSNKLSLYSHAVYHHMNHGRPGPRPGSSLHTLTPQCHLRLSLCQYSTHHIGTDSSRGVLDVDLRSLLFTRLSTILLL